MSIGKKIPFVAATLLLAAAAYAQPGCVAFAYLSEYGAPYGLGYPCSAPRTCFPDGYPIEIYWDSSGTGPHPDDPQPPDFSSFSFDGDVIGEGAGYFYSMNAFCVFQLPAHPRYYLRITHHNPDICWTSAVYTLVPGPNPDWETTWTCDSTGACLAQLNSTAAPSASAIPDHFSLSQNYPNPFNPATEIEFAVPDPTVVRIRIFNIAGQLVRTVADGHYDIGSHHVKWDGKSNTGNSVSSGIYIYRMDAGNFSRTRKMLLVK